MDKFYEYLKLCFFNVWLEDLPKSVGLLRSALVIYVISEFFIQINIGGDPIQAFLETVVETLLTFVFVVLMLMVAKKTHFFLQTYTSFIITENLLFISVSPILFWIDLINDLLTPYFAITVISILVIWCLAILSFVIRQIFVISKFASVLLALSYLAVTYVGTYTLLSD